ncbi:MAG: hypothetical protein ACI9BH_002263, partial [Paracoccaceae bacterium]
DEVVARNVRATTYLGKKREVISRWAGFQLLPVGHVQIIALWARFQT